MLASQAPLQIPDGDYVREGPCAGGVQEDTGGDKGQDEQGVVPALQPLSLCLSPPVSSCTPPAQSPSRTYSPSGICKGLCDASTTLPQHPPHTRDSSSSPPFPKRVLIIAVAVAKVIFSVFFWVISGGTERVLGLKFGENVVGGW